MKRFLSLARIAVFGLMIFAISCREAQEEAVFTQPEKAGASGNKIAAEEAFPGEKGESKRGKLFGTEITYSEINGKAVFQGDIILAPEQLVENEGKNARTDGAGLADRVRLWPNGVINYTIGPNVNEAVVNEAIVEVEAKTPVRFVKNARMGSNYVTFTAGRGPSSSVGMVGGQQFITLGLGFSKGTVLHEIGHTLGMFHEHTRVKRDEVLAIRTENILPGYQSAFNTYQQDAYKGFDFQYFDFGSIMLMSSYLYSSNGKPTMVSKFGYEPYEIQRTKLSENDANTLISMYSNLYTISGSRFYTGHAGTSKNVASVAWWDYVTGMTADAEWVYAVRGDELQKVSTFSSLGTTIAKGFKGVKYMATYKNQLYALINGYLTRIDTQTGQRTTLGSNVWGNAVTAMTYCNGKFYIINDDYLFRVNPEDGTSMLVNADYLGVTELTSAGKGLFMVKDGYVYLIDSTNGIRMKMLNFQFSYTPKLCGLDGKLYLIGGSALYKIDPANRPEYLMDAYVGSGWGGTTFVVARRGVND